MIMSKNDYEYECMRAELLGLDKPDENLFYNQESESSSLEALAGEGEQLGRVSGGLDELNTVIDSTKKKLTKYQTLTGRLGGLLKRSSPVDKSLNHTNTEIPSQINSDCKKTQLLHSSNISTNIKTDEMEKQVDKLDLLLMKAERAEMSLSHNNKLIKRIAKK